MPSLSLVVDSAMLVKWGWWKREESERERGERDRAKKITHECVLVFALYNL